MEESLHVNSVYADIYIDYYMDLDECDKMNKQEVNDTLAELWENSQVQNPETEIIPTYEQLRKLTNIVQECFCRFEKVAIKLRGSKDSPEAWEGCFDDLEEKLAAWNALDIQARDYEGKKSREDFQVDSSSEDESEEDEEEQSEEDDESDGSSENPSKIPKTAY